MTLLAAGPIPATKLLVLLGGLIVAVVVLGLVILKVRGATLGKSASGADQEGLLAGLRRMRDAGEISPDEYDAARKGMAAKAAGMKQQRPGLVAKPGFDLTGAPLPPSESDG